MTDESPSEQTRRFNSAWLAPSVSYPIIIFVVVMVAWEAASREGIFPPYLVPAPSVILARAIDTADLMLGHALVTSWEIVLGFLLAVWIGVLFAAAITFIRPVEQAIYPWLVVIQVLPKVALGPVLIVWLGLGLLPKILISFMLAFFPITINTMAGLKSVHRDSLFLLRSMGAGPIKTFRFLQLPNALPNLFSALKVAITLATVGAIVGEFIGADTGLGYVLILANGNLDTSLMFVALLWITAIALLFYAVIGVLEKLVIHWHVSARHDQSGASY
jgi:NitT/TauT family transport system permease protein